MTIQNNQQKKQLVDQEEWNYYILHMFVTRRDSRIDERFLNLRVFKKKIIFPNSLEISLWGNKKYNNKFIITEWADVSSV